MCVQLLQLRVVLRFRQRRWRWRGCAWSFCCRCVSRRSVHEERIVHHLSRLHSSSRLRRQRIAREQIENGRRRTRHIGNELWHNLKVGNWCNRRRRRRCSCRLRVDYLWRYIASLLLLRSHRVQEPLREPAMEDRGTTRGLACGTRARRQRGEHPFQWMDFIRSLAAMSRAISTLSAS